MVFKDLEGGEEGMGVGGKRQWVQINIFFTLSMHRSGFLLNSLS